MQVCGDPDLRAVQALQREDAEYPGARICRGTGSQSAQTEETKHGTKYIVKLLLQYLHLLVVSLNINFTVSNFQENNIFLCLD